MEEGEERGGRRGQRRRAEEEAFKPGSIAQRI